MKPSEISVIVPVYNAEKYLPSCVDSILGQTFSDFELFLVDDGSTDSSGEVCDRYSERDLRIRVIHQQNAGVSKARNCGLDAARGEYIVFVDADDRVRPNYLSDLIIASRRLGIDQQRTLVLSDYQPFSDDGIEGRSFPEPFSMDFKMKQGMTAEHFRELIFQFRLFPPYCKLYRRDIIEMNHIRFREGMRTAEDFEFNSRYLAVVDHVEYIGSIQYDYRIGYKKYVPSNYGVLGDSEIKSAHIMANGITDLAKRMGIMDEVRTEIDLWAANKHYYNRLRMLFAQSENVEKQERRKLYSLLISDPIYYDSAHRGARYLPKSATKIIACFADYFSVWWRFYKKRSVEER